MKPHKIVMKLAFFFVAIAEALAACSTWLDAAGK